MKYLELQNDIEELKIIPANNSI